MTDRILYIAFGLSLTGLFLLTYASGILEPPLSDISEVRDASLGRYVHIRGDVSGIHRFDGGSAMVSLDDGTGEIDVYMSYYVVKSKPGILDAPGLEVIGELDEYKGSLEVKPRDSNCVIVTG